MTKKYKIGDTVYVKGTIGRTDDTRNPCYVEFDYGVEGWIPRNTIIDELPTAEPVKPVLPKVVGEELDSSKADYAIQDFDLYIRNIIGCANSAKASNHYYLNNTNAIIKLADAWRYGYTIEKPKLYNLILSEDYYKGAVVCLYKPIQSYELYTISSINDDDLKHNKKYQFTQEEIDKYNKDFWIKNFDLNDYKIEVRTDED